jgi:hypothetical protein
VRIRDARTSFLRSCAVSVRGITDEGGVSTGGATTENQDPTSGSRAEPAAEHTPAELLPSEPFSMPKVHLDALEGQGGAVPPPTLIQPKNTVTRAKQQIGRGT